MPSFAPMNLSATRASRSLLTCAGLGLLAFAPGCNHDNNDSANGLEDSVAASAFDSELPVAWFETLYGLVKSNGTPPPLASRIYGYTGVTLYEAVVHGIENDQSLAGQLNGLTTLPEPEDALYHWPTVANAALAAAVTGFYPGNSATIDALEMGFLDDYELTEDPAVITRSVAYGQDLAQAILAWAADDGFADLTACNAAFVPPVLPGGGEWTGTGTGLQPCWGTLRTFVVTDSSECGAVGAPAFSTDPDSAFYAHALVVYNTTGDAGAGLTVDQAEIANFWADGATATGTPPGHWVSITGIVLQDQGLTLDVAGEAYARVGMAVADAFITCWQTKFTDYLMRPITYIQANIDGAWDPLLGTPNFPSYTSGHSTQSGAAASVLTAVFGPTAFLDTTHSTLDAGLGVGDRSFDNFFEAAGEAAESRLFGGIHYVFDNEDGFDQGLCIGAIHNATLQFQAN